MCSQATKDVIESVVTERVNNGESFTAYDVSKRVQEELIKTGKIVWDEHRHKVIKNDIHLAVAVYVDNSSYERSLQDVGASTGAFVYVPRGGDPAAYQPQPRNDAPGPATPTTSAPRSVTGYTPPTLPVSPMDDDEGDEKDTEGRTVDARGTLAVPVPILTAAQIAPMDTVYVSPVERNNKKALALSKRALPNTDHITTYTVDTNGNVRVTSPILAKAGMGGNVSFNFERDGDVAYVTLHG